MNVTLAPDFAFAHPGYGERIRFSNNQLHLHTPAFPRRAAPELCLNLSPNKGRGECRVPVAPAAACAVVESTRVSHHEFTGITRHSRTRWCYSLFRALPGDRACLSPSSAKY